MTCSQTVYRLYAPPYPWFRAGAEAFPFHNNEQYISRSRGILHPPQLGWTATQQTVQLSHKLGAYNSRRPAPLSVRDWAQGARARRRPLRPPPAAATCDRGRGAGAVALDWTRLDLNIRKQSSLRPRRARQTGVRRTQHRLHRPLTHDRDAPPWAPARRRGQCVRGRDGLQGSERRGRRRRAVRERMCGVGAGIFRHGAAAIPRRRVGCAGDAIRLALATIDAYPHLAARGHRWGEEGGAFGARAGERLRPRPTGRAIGGMGPQSWAAGRRAAAGAVRALCWRLPAAERWHGLWALGWRRLVRVQACVRGEQGRGFRLGGQLWVPCACTDVLPHFARRR